MSDRLTGLFKWARNLNDEGNALGEPLMEYATAWQAERDALKAENAALRKDKERLDWFESEVNTGGCPALVFDDNKFWAVSTEGIQTSITGDLPKDYEASIYVEAKAQRETVREAIDVAMQEEE